MALFRRWLQGEGGALPAHPLLGDQAESSTIQCRLRTNVGGRNTEDLQIKYSYGNKQQ